MKETTISKLAKLIIIVSLTVILFTDDRFLPFFPKQIILDNILLILIGAIIFVLFRIYSKK